MTQLKWILHGIAIDARRCILHGFYNRFEACVTDQKECLEYRVKGTEQGELGAGLKSL